METRKTKVIFTKAGGNANGSPSICRISLPKAWVNRMGLTPERREVELAFDGNKVSIQSLKESPAKRRMLADKKKIRRFALVWGQMYKNHAAVPQRYFELAELVGDGMADLGFEMDAGESMRRAFPEADAFHDNEALKGISSKVDLQTLGNAIFSRWRYWNHWAMGPMQEADFEWFVIAFSRLAELAEDL